MRLLTAISAALLSTAVLTAPALAAQCNHPAGFDAFIRTDFDNMKEAARLAGIKPE